MAKMTKKRTKKTIANHLISATVVLTMAVLTGAMLLPHTTTAMEVEELDNEFMVIGSNLSHGESSLGDISFTEKLGVNNDIYQKNGNSICIGTAASNEILGLEQLQEKKTTPALAQTTELASEEQICALSIKEVQAIKPEEMGNMCKSLVQAFGLDQVKVFSAKQIVGLGLSIRYLIKEQISVLSPQCIKAIEALYMGHLDSSQIRALTPPQVKVLTKKQIEGLRYNIQFLTEKQISVLSLECIKAIQPEYIGYFSPERINALTQLQIALLSTEQICQLSLASVGAMNPELVAKLNKEQLQALTAEQVNKLTPVQIEHLKRNINWLKVEQIRELSLDCIKAITPRYMASMHESQLRGLTPAQKAVLDKEQQGIYDIKIMPIDGIKQLTPQYIAGLSTYQEEALTVEQICKLSPDCIKVIKPADLCGSISQDRTEAELRQAKLQALTALQVRALTPEHIRFGCSSGGIIKYMTTEQISQLPAECIKTMPLAGVKYLDKSQRQALIAQIKTVTGQEKVYELSTTDMKTLELLHDDIILLEKTPTLTTEQIRELSVNAIKEMQPEIFQSLNESQLRALTTEQLKVLSEKQFDFWERAINCLTTEQISQLPAECVNSIHPYFTSVSYIKKFTEQQIAALTTEHQKILWIKKMSAADIIALKDEDIPTALSLEQTMLLMLELARAADQACRTDKEQRRSLKLVADHRRSLKSAADQISLLHPKLIKALCLDGVQLSVYMCALASTRATELTLEQIRNLSSEYVLNSLFSALSPECIAVIGPEHMKKLSVSRLQELTPEQKQALTAEQWQALTQEQKQTLAGPYHRCQKVIM